MHLLKVSAELLDDYTAPDVIRRPESAKWQEVLEQLLSHNMVIFTKDGLMIKRRER